MYFLVIQYSSLVKQNVTYMNRNITIQHNHADKLREGQDMNKKENHSVKSEIEQYQEQLQTAIDEQNFELAAELRDKIKALSEKLE
jgi:protein-arginine kinase activator protein McsA